MVAHRLANGADLRATLSQRRAIIYITVEWSVQERYSRRAFAQFVERIEGTQLQLGVSVWVLGEECEGIVEWIEELRLSGAEGSGYGSVVWLDVGEVMDVVGYAAAVGVDGLVERTLRLWGDA